MEEQGCHPHMANFLDAVRSRQEPNFPADLGYKAMAAIGLGVQAYRQSKVIHVRSGQAARDERLIDESTIAAPL